MFLISSLGPGHPVCILRRSPCGILAVLVVKTKKQSPDVTTHIAVAGAEAAN